MADLASTDITHTIIRKRSYRGRKHNLVRLAFGDGALTYPAGGVPMDKQKLGMPSVVESVTVVDKGTSGYEFKYDQSANKMVLTQNASHTHALHFNDAEVADGATTRVNAGTNLLSTNTGTDIAVAGVADTTGAGGIVNSAALAGAQPSAVAIAAQTIECEVVGW